MRRHEVSAILETSLLVGQREPWGANWTAAGVIEVLGPFVGERRRERIEAVIGQRISSVTVVMDAPHDPHNGAAVLRSCDAFGIPELHVVPRDEPFLAGRAVAKGTQHWVDVVLHETPDQAAFELRRQGFELVTTHPDGKLVPEDLRSVPRLALVLGNERDGIREELEAAASVSVRIPMRGFVESLNVSVAAALLLRAATEGRPGDLAALERERLLARGMLNSVQKAAEILAASTPR